MLPSLGLVLNKPEPELINLTQVFPQVKDLFFGTPWVPINYDSTPALLFGFVPGAMPSSAPATSTSCALPGEAPLEACPKDFVPPVLILGGDTRGHAAPN